MNLTLANPSARVRCHSSPQIVNRTEFALRARFDWLSGPGRLGGHPSATAHRVFLERERERERERELRREGGKSLLAYVKGVDPHLIHIDRPTTIRSPEYISGWVNYRVFLYTLLGANLSGPPFTVRSLSRIYTAQLVSLLPDYQIALVQPHLHSCLFVCTMYRFTN